MPINRGSLGRVVFPGALQVHTCKLSLAAIVGERLANINCPHIGLRRFGVRATLSWPKQCLGYGEANSTKPKLNCYCGESLQKAKAAESLPPLRLLLVFRFTRLPEFHP